MELIEGRGYVIDWEKTPAPLDYIEAFIDKSDRSIVEVDIDSEKARSWIPFISGVDTAYSLHTKISHIHGKYITDGENSVSPGGAASLFISHLTKEHGIRAEATAPHLIPAPLYATRTKWLDLAYIDIVSAYHQIGSCIGWGCRLDGAKVKLGVPYNYPFVEHKQSRNAIIYFSRGGDAIVVHHNRVSKMPMKSKQNPSLWNIVLLALHTIAYDLITKFGCMYAHTDGFIVRGTNARIVMSYLKNEWGLDSKIKLQGKGKVFGVGSYSIGGEKTATYNSNSISKVVDYFTTQERKEFRRLIRWCEGRANYI